MRSISLLLLSLSLVAACGGASTSSTDDANLTNTDSAVVDLAAHAAQTVYVSLDTKQSSKLADALAAAVARGVAVKGVIVESDHDATWTLQQHLEGTGVDVDVVRTSP